MHSVDKALDIQSAAYIDMFTYDTHLHEVPYEEYEDVKAARAWLELCSTALKTPAPLTALCACDAPARTNSATYMRARVRKG